MTAEVVIDAELLVLLFAGSVSRDLPSKHKRLGAYSASDFDLLVEVLRAAKGIVVTPNVLTEASNLSRYIAEPDRSAISVAMKLVCEEAVEIFVPSKNAVQVADFVRLGLADVTVLEACEPARVLLTSDVDLYLTALGRGIDATNFAHLREARGTV